MRILDKILLLLKEQKKTQKSLMDHLCLSKNIFTDWKSGKCKSYNNYLPQIAEFFNVSIDYLAGRTQKQGDLEEGTYHGGRLVDDNKTNKDNDFTYAAYDELTHDLSLEQIEQLKTYADFLRNQK